MTDFDIMKSRNIPDTLFKATMDIHTKNKILIKCKSTQSKLAETNKEVCQGCHLSPTLFNITEIK